MLSWVSLVSLGTLTAVGGAVIVAAGAHPARVVLALVEGAAVGVGVAPGAGRTLADVAAVLVDAPGSSSAGVAQTLIEVHTLQI